MSENESKFNLWKEPWICVLTKEQKIIEVSLEDALINSQDYIDLAGELPTQNFAILRLLLALVHTIFFKKSPDEPQDSWFELWNKKCFAKEPVITYKNQWLDRFFLFDKIYPFYQEPKISDVNKGNNKEDKTKPVEKLNGEISESAHKKRLFLLREGNEKNSLSFSEAARWLIHNNCYDDTSLKKPSPKIGWCGQLWCIYGKGNNLFETLMLNLILWKDANSPWNENIPWWESKYEFISSKEKEIDSYQMKIPDNPAALYTIQQRYVRLDKIDDRVTSYSARSGIWFSNINAFDEQMTLWKAYKKTDSSIEYCPKIPDKSIQIWREFSSIAAEEDKGDHVPGIINWIASLRNYLGQNYFVRFQTVAINYDPNKSSIENVYSDSLELYIDILTTLGRQWRSVICNEVSRCQKIAKIFERYSSNLQKALGITDKKETDRICENFYYKIDIPFRNWIAEINPNDFTKQKEAEIKNWHAQSINLALSYGESLLKDIGGEVRACRIEKKNGKTASIYSIPRAYNIFIAELYRLDEKE